MEATFKKRMQQVWRFTSLEEFARSAPVLTIGVEIHSRGAKPFPKQSFKDEKLVHWTKGQIFFFMMWCDRIFNWLGGSNFFWPGLNFCNIKNHQKTSESINLLDLPTALLNLYIYRFRKQEKNWLKSFIFSATLVRIT